MELHSVPRPNSTTCPLSLYEWSWFHGKGVLGQTLQEVCLFRSTVLHNHGFRNQFSQDGALYGDVSYSDFESFHLTARSGGKLVGTVRVTPPSAPNVARTVLGSEKYLELLHIAGATPERVIEINRLMIDETIRRSGLGKTLMYGAVALIEALFKREDYFILGSAGNCTRQKDFFLKNTDYDVIPGITNHYAAEFNDEITFLSYAHPPYSKGAREIEWFRENLDLP